MTTVVGRHRIDPLDIHAQRAAENLVKINNLLDEVSEGIKSTKESLRALKKAIVQLKREIGKAPKDSSTVEIDLGNFLPVSMMDGIGYVFGPAMAHALKTIKPFSLNGESMELVSNDNEIPSVRRKLSTMLEVSNVPWLLDKMIKKFFPDVLVIHFNEIITARLGKISRQRLLIEDIEGIVIYGGPDPSTLDIDLSEPEFTLGTLIYDFETDPFDYFDKDFENAEEILDEIDDSLDDTLDERNKKILERYYISARNRFDKIQEEID